MTFLDEMLTKWGFEDGEQIPNGIDEIRDMHIEAINRLAEKNGSGFRAMKYDRFGMHNWCMIVFVPTGGTIDDTVLEENTDDAFKHALLEVREANLDSKIHISVEIDDDYDFDEVFSYPRN